MNDPLSTCDPHRIDQCLADSLSDEERAAFEAHLESCSACREVLESSAAAPHDWQSVRTFLSSDASLPLPLGEGWGEGAGAIGEETGSVDAGSERIGGRRARWRWPRPTIRECSAGWAAYEIAGVVGRGGMGVVLKALDPALESLCGDQSARPAIGHQRRCPATVRPRSPSGGLGGSRKCGGHSRRGG